MSGTEGASEVSPPTTEFGSLECGYSNIRELQRIERSLLRSLAAASLERASGEIFSRPTSVAPEVRKDMIDFLNQQSEGYQLGLGQWSYSSSRSPSATVDDMLDAFIKSKRNLFRRVSSRLTAGLTDATDGGKVEELAAELERSGAWSMGQREHLAKMLLKRLDIHKTSYCEIRVETAEDLAEHKKECTFRPLACESDGCGEVFSALHADSHEAECPFKVVDCRQGCGETIRRLDMDKHCSTVCLMKLVSCPFATVGCSHVLPQGALEQHFGSMVSPHLLFVLQLLQRQESVVAGQAHRVSLLEKSVNLTERTEAVDVNSLILTVKEQDAKMKKMEEELKKLRKEVAKSGGDVTAKLTKIEKNLQAQ